MKIMIPTGNSDNVGLRAIIGKNEVEKVMVILRDAFIAAQSATGAAMKAIQTVRGR